MNDQIISSLIFKGFLLPFALNIKYTFDAMDFDPLSKKRETSRHRPEPKKE
jgi:hypothetical protein